MTSEEAIPTITVEDLLQHLNDEQDRLAEILQEAEEQREAQIFAAFEAAGGDEAGLAAMEAMRRTLTQ